MRLLTMILAAAIVGTTFGAVWGHLGIAPAAPTESLSVDSLLTDAADEIDNDQYARFEVDDKDFDFGVMQRGTSRSHTFVISNSGGKPLRLTLGQPSCKCTVGELSKDVLDPGESVDLEVTWKAQAEAGPFKQWVPITVVNDPRISQIELSVAGEITQPSGLMPREFIYGKVPAGESRTSEVFLMAYLQDQVEIKTAEISSEEARKHFDIEIVELSKDDLPDKKAAAGVRIAVTAKAGMPIGRFTQWLALETNVPDVATLEIPILGQVVGDISIAGPGWSDEHGVLQLGRVIGTKGKHADLNVIVRGEQAADIQVEVAATEPSEMVATLGEPRKYKDTLFHVPLRIEIPPGTRSMVHLNSNLHEPATVTLKTTHPQAPELVLDVRFAVEN